MSTQGLIQYSTIFYDHSKDAEINHLFQNIDPLVSSTGDYMEVSIGVFAADLYGPTSITAGIGLAYSQYSMHDEGEVGAEWLERAEEIAETIHDKAFAEDHYHFHPDNPKLYLYPNSTMILFLNQLYIRTGKEHYLNRSEKVFSGIQPLKYKDMGFYRSPYCEEYEGAQTEEYSTISSQNYLMLGLLELYEFTCNPIYLENIFDMLNHINTRLYDEDENKIVHHWIDGRPSNPQDPSYFCSGCNLQTLYILWYLTQRLDIELR